MKLPTPEELLNSPEGLKWKLVHYAQSKLENTRKSSIILAAFSFSVFSSCQIILPTSCPDWIYTALAINTAVLVSLHSFSFIICTFLLPKIQAVTQEYKPPRYGDLYIKKVPLFSPHEKFSGFVGFSYRSAHTLGLFLFLTEVIFIAWVKLYDHTITACIISTVIMIPFIIIFAIFCIHFHRILNQHAYEIRSNLLQDVEREFSLNEPSPPLSTRKRLSFENNTRETSFIDNIGIYNKSYKYEE